VPGVTIDPGDDADLLPEVWVGRAPVVTPGGCRAIRAQDTHVRDDTRPRTTWRTC
jgi:hypothetical protein